MHNDLTLTGADTPASLARLRAFVAARGAAATAELERHLARPRHRPAFTRIAERAGTIAGYALLAHERLRLGAATLEAGCVAALHTSHAEEPMVFAALLGDCLGVLAEEALPLALLRGSLADYGPFGLAAYCFSSIGACRAPDHVPGGQLRAALADDLEDIAALYEASHSQLALTQIRAAPDWRRRLAEDQVTWVLEDGRGRLIGYAAIDAHSQGYQAPLAVHEAAAADAGAARALYLALLGHAQRHDNAPLQLHLSPWHVLAQAALQLGGQLSLAAATPSDAMRLAGVVDLPLLLEALAPELERRLAYSRYAGWSGNLRLELETERIVVAFDAGQASVIDGSRPADLRLRRIALPALAQLCLGYRAAADLRATGELDYDDSALGLLDGLFPVLLATD
jgi:hypothetical protein